MKKIILHLIKKELGLNIIILKTRTPPITSSPLIILLILLLILLLLLLNMLLLLLRNLLLLIMPALPLVGFLLQIPSLTRIRTLVLEIGLEEFFYWPSVGVPIYKIVSLTSLG